MKPEIRPSIKNDVANGNLTDEGDRQLFVDEKDISVIVSTEHSVHLQMFEEGEMPQGVYQAIKKMDMLASSTFLEQINIRDDRPLVVHLNKRNLHFRTAAEIMCYVDGMQQVLDVVFERLSEAQNEEAGS